MRGGVLVLAWVVTLSACGDGEGNEARLVIDLLEGLAALEVEERRRRVDALGAMPVDSEQVRTVRDRCVAMHDAVLRAEEATAEARAAAALLPTDEDAVRTPAIEEARLTVEAALARSEAAIAETGPLQEPCEEALASLRTRYAPSRPGSGGSNSH